MGADAHEEWWENRARSSRTPPRSPRPGVPGAAFRVRRLQVIVKLATIPPTLEKPEYAGGSWRVEGVLNGPIVWTGIYYWDSENVTESRLSFRAALDDSAYEQNDDKGLREVFGLEGGDALNQLPGSSSTPAGRCLAFPNVYLHRVGSFRVADPARPGHREILAFSLCEH
ncbi:DUF4246 family protein [Streptomyces sp. NPDC004285]